MANEDLIRGSIEAAAATAAIQTVLVEKGILTNEEVEVWQNKFTRELCEKIGIEYKELSK